MLIKRVCSVRIVCTVKVLKGLRTKGKMFFYDLKTAVYFDETGISTLAEIY